MSRILVTGGNGGLGRPLVSRLQGAGLNVRVMSRQPRPPGLDPALEWATADLASGAGLAEALAGCDIVVHAASNARQNTLAVDVAGARALVQAAETAGLRHLLYVSIVGIDRIPHPYYRAKLAAEAEVQAGRVPWSILRATQFHSLIDGLYLAPYRTLPVFFMPSDLKFQSADTDEVAGQIARLATEPPAGRLPDMGGPEVLSLGEMAVVWFAAQSKRPLRLPLWLPGGFAAALRRGENTCPDHRDGRITWADWVRRQYAPGRP